MSLYGLQMFTAQLLRHINKRIFSCNSLHCLKQYIMLFLYKVCESCSVVSNSLWPRGLYSPWNSPGQNTGVGSLSLLQGKSSQSRDWTQVSRIAGRFFTSELQEKPKNNGVGSLPLLQRIFPTQELNQGLLYCRQILYQLNYQGSPKYKKTKYIYKV